MVYKWLDSDIRDCLTIALPLHLQISPHHLHNSDHSHAGLALNSGPAHGSAFTLDSALDSVLAHGCVLYHDHTTSMLPGSLRYRSLLM